MILVNKYEIIDKIGEGSFGAIFQGVNIRTKEKIAIKVESIQSQLKLLKNESTLYQYLKDVKGIPNVKWFGKDQHHYYMVLPLLGESLENIKEKNNKISILFIHQIGVQLIELVELIHEKGLVHRDIKPENFLFGLDTSQLYLIDLGFCKFYLKNEQHIIQKQTKKLIGSANFASINSHDHIELSRRDDLESVGYILYYLYYRYLEWSSVLLHENYVKNNIEIKKRKQQIIEKPNLPLFIKNYFEIIWKMKFDEKPNYLLLRNILNE
jgi:serine/threonine protein kinase